MSAAYQRAPQLDKRILRGDDFAGDAWVRWTAVGQAPEDSEQERRAKAYPALVAALQSCNAELHGSELGGFLNALLLELGERS